MSEFDDTKNRKENNVQLDEIKSRRNLNPRFQEAARLSSETVSHTMYVSHAPALFSIDNRVKKKGVNRGKHVLRKNLYGNPRGGGAERSLNA